MGAVVVAVARVRRGEWAWCCVDRREASAVGLAGGVGARGEASRDGGRGVMGIGVSVAMEEARAWRGERAQRRLDAGDAQ